MGFIENTCHYTLYFYVNVLLGSVITTAIGLTHCISDNNKITLGGGYLKYLFILITRFN